MLDTVRRWLTGDDSLPAWQKLAAWAREHRWTLIRTTAQDGWVMENDTTHPGWRIEWGPAQRIFMGGHELRIRVALPQMPEVQALVLDQPLLARLDRELYQQFTSSVQTRFDDETPEEMRWLAMHAKLEPHEVSASLRDRYGVIGNEPAWVAQWLAGPLARALETRADAMPAEAVAAQPFVMRLARGQMVIRQAASEPRLDVLVPCVEVAVAGEAALARMVAGHRASQV